MNTPTTSQTASPLASVKINRMAIRVPGIVTGNSDQTGHNP